MVPLPWIGWRTVIYPFLAYLCDICVAVSIKVKGEVSRSRNVSTVCFFPWGPWNTSITVDLFSITFKEKVVYNNKSFYYYYYWTTFRVIEGFPSIKQLSNFSYFSSSRLTTTVVLLCVLFLRVRMPSAHNFHYLRITGGILLIISFIFASLLRHMMQNPPNAFKCNPPKTWNA